MPEHPGDHPGPLGSTDPFSIARALGNLILDRLGLGLVGVRMRYQRGRERDASQVVHNGAPTAMYPLKRQKMCLASAQLCLSALALAFVLALGGCNVAGFAAVTYDNYQRSGTHRVAEEYKGLAAKSWAVVVIADRSIQAETPDLLPWMTRQICERLTKEQPKIGAREWRRRSGCCGINMTTRRGLRCPTES